MFAIFLGVPVVLGITMGLLYKYNGKKELFRMDLVQFVYGFVILPLLFIWMKSFVYYLLREELALGLSPRELFLIDTGMSTLFLYVYAFVVIHSLTKTLNLKYYSDPLYDIFQHTEYYHVWLSHVVMYVGGMSLMSLLGIINVFIPLAGDLTRLDILSVIGFGLLSGVLMFVGIWLSDPEHPNFMRLMKLAISFFFVIHVVIYFAFNPTLRAQYSLYWFTFLNFLVGTLCSLFFERSDKAVRWTEKLKHDLWEMKLKTWVDFYKKKS